MDHQNFPVIQKINCSMLCREKISSVYQSTSKRYLRLGKYLFRSEEPIEYVYFLDRAIGSIVAMTPEGQTVEVGVGFEGGVGLDVLMGVDSTLNESMIQIPDGVMRITTALARQEFERGGRSRRLFCANCIHLCRKSARLRSATVCIRPNRDCRAGF
jgi:hypothetical protein